MDIYLFHNLSSIRPSHTEILNSELYFLLHCFCSPFLEVNLRNDTAVRRLYKGLNGIRSIAFRVINTSRFHFLRPAKNLHCSCRAVLCLRYNVLTPSSTTMIQSKSNKTKLKRYLAKRSRWSRHAQPGTSAAPVVPVRAHHSLVHITFLYHCRHFYIPSAHAQHAAPPLSTGSGYNLPLHPMLFPYTADLNCSFQQSYRPY